MKLICRLFIALFVAVLSLPAYGEYTTADLLSMTLESLSYDKEADTAHVCGVGKIVHDGSIGEVLARRAAVADAQRGFLILRRGIKEGKPFRPDSVSGRVPPFRIVSEYIRDGVYFVEAETRLSELMKSREFHSAFAPLEEDDGDEEDSEEDTHDESSKDYPVPDTDSLVI